MVTLAPYCVLIGNDKMCCQRRAFQLWATKTTPANPVMPVKWKAPLDQQTWLKVIAHLAPKAYDCLTIGSNWQCEEDIFSDQLM